MCSLVLEIIDLMVEVQNIFPSAGMLYSPFGNPRHSHYSYAGEPPLLFKEKQKATREEVSIFCSLYQLMAPVITD